MLSAFEFSLVFFNLPAKKQMAVEFFKNNCQNSLWNVSQKSIHCIIGVTMQGRQKRGGGQLPPHISAE